ncbi:MAG: ABC transporter permease [Betaproteobacteria bacterium]
MNRNQKCLLQIALAATAMTPAFVQAQSAAYAVCAPVAIPNHYGPYDYATEQGKLSIVDGAHFTPNVENLIGGNTGYLGGDLSYTLNASPNHHRALLAAMKFAIRERNDQPPHMKYSISCYLDRATRFRPKDTVVRGLYAKYLFDFLKQKDKALQQVSIAVEYAGDNPWTHYNAGLLYFEMGEYDKSVERAAFARDLGYTRDDLIAKLKAINRWPAEVGSASASSGASAPTVNRP